MLMRHSFYYLLARGLPGILSLVSLALYTRLMDVTDFGHYALVLAGVGLVDIVVFQWLRQVLARFLPTYESPAVIQSAVLALFMPLAGVTFAVGLALACAWPDPTWRTLIVWATFLTIAQAWLQLDIGFASAKLDPKRYGQLLGSKNLIALIVGAFLAWKGYGAESPLIGLMAGTIAAWVLFSIPRWRGISPRWPQQQELANYCGYGLPLIATFALGWIISSSDRFLIAWFIDEAAAGTYAVGYDLAQYNLGFILAIVNTAAYPLVMQKIEKEGESAATKQLEHNGQLIIALSLAGAVGLTILGPALIEVFIGKNFRVGAMQIMPWIALSAAVAGIKAFHFDIAFQLTKRSMWQAYTSVFAAVLNVGLNVLLIPKFGILGAAWATLLAFIFAATVSGYLGKKVFPMPAFSKLLWRGSLVALAAGLGSGVVVFGDWGAVETLVGGAVLGGFMAVLTAIWLDVAGARAAIAQYINSESK